MTALNCEKAFEQFTQFDVVLWFEVMQTLSNTWLLFSMGSTVDA